MVKVKLDALGVEASSNDTHRGGTYPQEAQVINTKENMAEMTPKVPPAHRRGSFDKNVNPQNMKGQSDSLDKYGEV